MLLILLLDREEIAPNEWAAFVAMALVRDRIDHFLAMANAAELGDGQEFFQRINGLAFSETICVG